MEAKITLLEAYKAMILFLDEYYVNFGQDNLVSILGSIQLKPDLSTVDPAAWYDWLEVVKKVVEEKKE